MNVFPILNYDHGCGCDGEQYGQWCSYLKRHYERQQGDCDQSFAKSKGGPDQRGHKNDGQNEYK